MRCPYCFNLETQVVDSRETEDQASVWRRRDCPKCSKRFTTYERVELGDLIVIKKDGSSESFDRAKVLAGIRRACEKRPIPTERIERAVDEIESELRLVKESETPSRKVVEPRDEAPASSDPVAYIRFASVYKSFEDLAAFERELDKLKD